MIAVADAAVEVVHGAEFVRRSELEGATVAQATSYLCHVLNVRSHAAARLNGHDARPDDMLLPGDVLEFLDGPGQKGIDELLTPQEFLEVTRLLASEYEYLLAQGMPAHNFSGGLKLVMTEIREWLREQPGSFMAAAKKAVAYARLRINKDQSSVIFDGRPYPVTDEQAAILEVLHDNMDNWVSSTEIMKARPLLSGVRCDRRIKELPQPIHALIETEKKGRRLRLE